MIQLWVKSTTKKPVIANPWECSTHWCGGDSVRCHRPALLRGGHMCVLLSGWLQRIVFCIQPWKRPLITVYSQNWHATWETVNVFVFIGTIWLSNAEESNPPYALQHHSKYSHTHVVVTGRQSHRRWLVSDLWFTVRPCSLFSGLSLCISALINIFNQFLNTIRLYCYYCYNIS